MTPIIEHVFDAILRVDKNFTLKFISDAGLRWFGGASPSVSGSFLDFVFEDDIDVIKAEFQNDNISCYVRLLKHDNPVWVVLRGSKMPIVDQYMICIIDINDYAGSGIDAELLHASEHDSLTGLANRSKLRKVVDGYIESGKPSFSVALLDLDGFKKVNDTLGHHSGDQVLIETTTRLLKTIEEVDFIARLGGDEFVVVLNNDEVDRDLKILDRIRLAIARPYETAPHDAYLGVSIGVATYPEHGDCYTNLLKNADTAMYFSKNAGKNRISRYNPTSESTDFSISSAIHKGILEGEFYLEFQPQYTTNGAIYGAESLMRWSSSTFGRVPPDKFIPIVEQTGLMPFLGKWALRYACFQLKAFQEIMPSFILSVNVSPVQLNDDFDTIVMDAVNAAGIDPKTLILEITESTLMQSPEKTEKLLARLCEQGITFSIDDFGTGFSSLAYLTRLPVSCIKIDKAFVQAIEKQNEDDTPDRRLISAMLNLAKSIDLKCVAEGVETKEQFEFLKASGCDFIQGYLFSKPISSDGVMALLEVKV